MSIVLDGTTGITTPAVSGDAITDEAGTGAPDFPNGIEVGGQTLLMPANSALITLSGSSVDFTGIPATARRVTVMINGLSTNGTTTPLIQIGDAGGIETSGYVGSSVVLTPSSTTAVQHTAGAGVSSTWAGSIIINGSVSIELMDATTNLWVITGVIGRVDGAAGHIIGYTKSLSETLTQLRLTTNSANTFDAGTASVSWE
jgi:hypothetical protein